MRLNIELTYFVDYKFSTGNEGIDYNIDIEGDSFTITAKNTCSHQEAFANATASTLEATMSSLWTELRGTEAEMDELVSSGAQRVLAYTSAPNPSAYPSYDNGRVQLLDANGQRKYQEYRQREAQEKQRKLERTWQAARQGELVADLTWILPAEYQDDPYNPRMISRHLNFYLKKQTDRGGSTFLLTLQNYSDTLPLHTGRSTAQEVTNFIKSAVTQHIPRNWELCSTDTIEQSVDNIVEKAGLLPIERQRTRLVRPR